ncbi:proline-rich basic protein 1 [Vulpes vulpes]|uniref:Proline-rich basic protein 1 n=1 Tax=Vulpes vulpes TaxID=9627 RepID=A0A3Q7UZL3_VULVU
MLTALARPARPGLPGRLPAAPARRQDSSGSSGSYHTAPGSPGPPDVGPDAECRAHWPGVAPALGAGAQPRLSVSAQNSRQQPGPGSGFPRGPGSSPRPPQPQLRMLPSGEMEVIFGAGALFGRSDAADSEVQQLTARAFRSLSPPGPATPAPATPTPQAPDGGSRWATYLEVRPRGPSPGTPAQFECVEVALEEREAPARSRTVPKRQIELRPRPQSPPREAGAPPRPRLLLRTGSLDESLGRLQEAAGLVQTALARKLSPAAPAPSSATFGPTGRPECASRETARSTRKVPEEARSRPPRVHYGSAPTKAPRPWPSLRERAIRRDKPAPGTEPLGPVSSSIFLQSGEKTREARSQELKTRSPRQTPDRAILRAQSPPFESRGPREVPSKAGRPWSSSPLWQAPNGTVRGPPCPSPQNQPPWNRAIRRVSSPSFPEASRAWGDQDPAVEETVSRRSPSPPTVSQWTQGVARTRSPSPEAPSLWEVPQPAVGNTAEGSRSAYPPALSSSWEAPDRTNGTWNPSPQDTWGPTPQGSSVVSTSKALNGIGMEELELPRPSTPGTLELTEAQGQPLREVQDPAFRGSPPSPEAAAPELTLSRLVGPADADAPREALGLGEAASGRPRVAIPRPRDVRKMVKTTYAPSFPAGTAALRLPAPPVEPRAEEGGAPRTEALPPLASPAPAHYTSVYLKDFLPVVTHPYEPPEPPPDAVARDAPRPNGVLRRRAENSTAKPFARTEVRLPAALAVGRRPEGAGGAVRGPGGENREAEARRLVPDGEGRTSPLGGARASPQPPPTGPGGPQPPRPPCPRSPQAHPSSSAGTAPKLETPPVAPEPATAIQSSLLRESQASAGRTGPPQPRAASAPPTDRPLEGPFHGARRPPGTAYPGKVLVDPESGRCYFVEAPRQPRLRLLFDPESGQYVEVLLPPSPQVPPRRVYTPLALGSGLYPPAYGPLPGLSVPPSLAPPGCSGPQVPWASEAGPLDGMYYLPVSGTPSPAPPLLLCAPPNSSSSAQPGKGSLFSG